MTARSRPGAAILAVDGGNSKTDLVLVARDGTLLGAVRGPTISHQQVGIDAGMRTLARLTRVAGEAAGLAVGRGPLAQVGVHCLAGADFPGDVRLLATSIRRLDLASDVVVLNDAFAGLRAGTTRAWGVAVVMGQGVNVAGIGRDGRRLHHAPGDPTSGDWGGGRDIGNQALAAAIRARDGRGPRTSLERSVPGHFALSRPGDLTRAIYLGRVGSHRLAELSPVVFAAAAAGDAVARGILDRTADEAAALAISAIRALRLVRTDVEVVLCGGVFRAADAEFHERIWDGIGRVAMRARIVRLEAPPVLGAALLGLDRLAIAGRAAAETRLRAAMTHDGLASARIR